MSPAGRLGARHLKQKSSSWRHLCLGCSREPRKTRRSLPWISKGRLSSVVCRPAAIHRVIVCLCAPKAPQALRSCSFDGFDATEIYPPNHRLTKFREQGANVFHAPHRNPFPNFTGKGKLPLLTPAHHVDFDTGIGPSGPSIDEILTKPSSGKAPSLVFRRWLD